MGESVIGLTNVVQSRIVEEDFLKNKSCHSLGELVSGLHDPEAERDDLSCQQKVNHVLFVIL
jgi:hypothetical protein